MQRFRVFMDLVAAGLVMILGGCGGGGYVPIMGEPLNEETTLMELSEVEAVLDSLLVSDLVFVPGDGTEERIRGHEYDVAEPAGQKRPVRRRP